ncbi:MAG: thiamine-phosphate kinase [Gemmatimonadota bacterium]
MSDSPASGRGEFARIARLVETLGPAAQGIGDDAALLAGRDGAWVWTVDTLVEGVHFRFDWLAPEAIGHRALAASLSDLAAMGAEPVGALVTAAGPVSTIDARLEGIYGGLGALARAAGCPILGGDLSRADGPLHLTVTALGTVGTDPPLLRSGAQPGDTVWVTGTLGGPAAALELLERGEAPAARAGGAFERLAHPTPRLAEMRWLRERAVLHAGIDVSDGVSGDAAHLAEASGVRITLEPGRLPIHPGAIEAARLIGTDPTAWAVHGGEEYELLLCAAAGALEPLAAPFADAFDLQLTRIGDVAEGVGVYARAGNATMPLPAASWDHFR